MTVKPAIGFLSKDSDAQLDQDVETTIASMTGNANFPTPSPTLAAITTALSAFTVALADAADGGVEKPQSKTRGGPSWCRSCDSSPAMSSPPQTVI